MRLWRDHWGNWLTQHITSLTRGARPALGQVFRSLESILEVVTSCDATVEGSKVRHTSGQFQLTPPSGLAMTNGMHTSIRASFGSTASHGIAKMFTVV